MSTDDNGKKVGRASAYSAPALEKGFSVIELLATSPAGLTISEILNGLGLHSMSEIFRIIMVMENRGWLQKVTGTDKYRVTPKVLDIVFRAMPSYDLATVAVPLMAELSERIEQSCHLVVMNDTKAMVILRQEGPGPTGFIVRRGAEIDPIRTCSGHVLLAFAAPSALEPILEEAKLDAANKSQFISRLEVVRSKGYESMPSARTRGVTDISYPIFGPGGTVAAALTVPFLELIDGTQTITKTKAQKILCEIASRATSISGGQTPATYSQ